MRRIGSKDLPSVLALTGTGAAAVVSYMPAVRQPLMDHPTACIFRRITGLRCPFCGMTHAVIDLMHGQLAAAAGHNALVFVLLLGVLVAAMGRTQSGRRTLMALRRRRPSATPGRFALAAAAYSVIRDIA